MFGCDLKSGGESGIRTHVTLSSKHAFQACAFSHSAISPARIGWKNELNRTLRSTANLLTLPRLFVLLDSMGELAETAT